MIRFRRDFRAFVLVIHRDSDILVMSEELRDEESVWEDCFQRQAIVSLMLDGIPKADGFVGAGSMKGSVQKNMKTKLRCRSLRKKILELQ